MKRATGLLKVVAGYSTVFFVAIGMAFVQPVNARSLDAEIESLLSTITTANCDRLKAAGGTGGSSSAAQTAPGIIQERFEAARGEEDESKAGTVTELAPGLNLFFSAEYESLDRDVTTFEEGYESDILSFTGGADYQFTNQFMAGLAFTYSNHDGDFDGGGDFDNDSYGFTAFASFDPNNQFFLQVVAGYAFKEYDRTRQASFVIDPIGIGGGKPVSFGGSVTADYDGSAISAGILAGYDHQINTITIGPRLGIDVTYNEFDDYAEDGDTGLELFFDDADETSFQSRLGVEGSMVMSTGFGVLIPQVNVDWVHEFADNQRSETFSFVDDSASVAFHYEDEAPDRNFAEVSVGVSAVLPNGVITFARFRTILGHEFLDSYAGSLGIRVEL